MARRTVFSVFALGLAWIAPLVSHHAVSTVYDVATTTTIHGMVDRIVIRRPHPIVHLVVDLEGQEKRTWAVELDDPDARRAEVGVMALKPGDRVAVCGNPGRDPGAFKMRMLSIERPSDAFVLRSDVGMDNASCGG